jgi:DNA-binding transcriptional LysR family regulator
VEIAAFASEAYRSALPQRYAFRDVGWIAWAPPFEEVSPNPELAALIPGFRPAFASDDFLVQLRAAEAGLGAVILGRAEHPFSSSRLVELELDLGAVRRTLHLACARSALQIPRVRAVADLLAAEMARTVVRKKRR